MNLRRDALAIFRAALKAADPAEAVRRQLRAEGSVLVAGRRRHRLERFRRIYVIGAGKAGARMTQAVERVLGKRIAGGLVNVKYGHTGPTRRVDLNECGHPVPDARGLAGAARIAQIARAAGPEDLVICVISGGASALLPAPAPPMTLEEKQELTRRLLAAGATIHELNTVRKHVSTIKGGQLARLARPAALVTLILSDVIGDDLDIIGSGPTVPDRSTSGDAARILAKYGVPLPAALVETPKPGDADFERVENLIVGSNRLAVEAAARKARALGYRTLILSTMIEGEAREVAQVHAAIAKEMFASGRPLRPPACVISGGEPTVTVRGTGLGGRNQEFALAAAMALDGIPDVLVFSAGTDGTDGPTDAAGAFADGSTVRRAALLGLDPRRHLSDNDSYHFFQPLRDLVMTGPTGTNVMDIQLLLRKGD